MSKYPYLAIPILALCGLILACSTYESPSHREARELRIEIAKARTELASTHLALNATDDEAQIVFEKSQVAFDELVLEAR